MRKINSGDAYQPALLYYTRKLISAAWQKSNKYKEYVDAWFSLFTWDNFGIEKETDKETCNGL